MAQRPKIVMALVAALAATRRNQNRTARTGHRRTRLLAGHRIGRRSAHCTETGEISSYKMGRSDPAPHANDVRSEYVAEHTSGRRMRPLVIEKVEPTPLFPKVNRGLLLRQQAVLRLNNFGPRRDVLARITAGAAAAYLEDLGEVAPGAPANRLRLRI